MARQVTQCPVCDAPLRITELSCVRCETQLHGVFPAAPLARLPHEHQKFVETFVMCRGVIRDVERVLGVSYPTVRARLDAAVEALDRALAEPVTPVPPPPPAPPPVSAAEEAAREARRRAILRAVEDGELEPADAAEALRRL